MLVVDADGHHRHALGGHPHVPGDVSLGRFRHGDDPAQAPGHTGLHSEEAVPAPEGDLTNRGARLVELETAVDGDGMVQGGNHREAVPGQAQDAAAQALVVVDDVEVLAPRAEHPPGPQAEREGLGETGCAHEGELEGVDTVAELTHMGDPEGVVGPVQVEAGDLHQGNAVGEKGVGLAAEDHDAVAELGELAAQVVDVDTLAAGVRVAPIGEERDAQRSVHDARHEAMRLAAG